MTKAKARAIGKALPEESKRKLTRILMAIVALVKRERAEGVLSDPAAESESLDAAVKKAKVDVRKKTRKPSKK
jgi:hypothetical protein